MRLPVEVVQTLQRFAAAFPLPMCPACGSIEAREAKVRAWTLDAIAQVVFEHPDQGWGAKRADLGRPVSADTITQQVGQRMTSWDFIVSAGAENQAFNWEPESQDTTGQVFVPVDGKDLIGHPPPPVPPIEPTTDPDTNLVLQRLEGLEAQLEALQAAVTKAATESQARDGYMQGVLTTVVRALEQVKTMTFEGRAKAWWGSVRFEITPKAS